MIKNPYDVLGISVESSKEEAKSAYRKLVKKHHPDRGGDVKEFMKVQKAWELLDSLGDKAFNRKIGKPTHKTLFTFRRV